MEIKRPKRNLLHPFNFVLVPLVPLELLILAVAIWRLYNFKAEVIQSKNKIRVREGILFKNISEVNFEDVKNIYVEQNPFQGLIRVGTLRFATAATAVREITMEGIGDPEGTRDKIAEVLSSKEETTSEKTETIIETS